MTTFGFAFLAFGWIMCGLLCVGAVLSNPWVSRRLPLRLVRQLRGPLQDDPGHEDL